MISRGSEATIGIPLGKGCTDRFFPTPPSARRVPLSRLPPIQTQSLIQGAFTEYLLSARLSAQTSEIRGE